MKIEEEIKSRFTDDYQKLTVNLYLTHSRLAEPFQKLLSTFDITPTQYNILRILRGQKQNPVSIGIIKSRMIERNSDVSRVIDRLLKKDLIIRKKNKLDKRQKDIIISETGLVLLEKIMAVQGDTDRYFENLTLSEVQLMNDLLDKIRKSIPSTNE
ncbi:MarR family winged helix-turn-helix transcriptional regulator [Crocinitomix catalasitica]|uniref:MarR family winged helix-turn-helix transcriptional regulator n=1 Tax=Crocinitomix catalasitica TaxID=184607 RepID=UPI0005623700|nr:MarR family transcriptional regulator [Crocinitomix catalasitica]